MTDHVQTVFALLGPGDGRFADAAVWHRLEEDVGRALPADYKQVVDAYAPVQIN
ncbi:hypothetical protein [Streptomyces sp. NPDC048508]|uniref:hypothetical protein n=1 Tax=Streptomyces sp. NPDC048508 TaxID=3365561 RepID=UPI00371C1D07